MLAGEWTSVRFLHNEQGKFADWSERSGVNDLTGWWNGITAADYDQDGDIDYIVSNYGLNSSIKASKEKPVHIYAADFDKNGDIDAIPVVWYKDTAGVERPFTYHGIGDLAKEIVRVKGRLNNHHEMGVASLDSILSKEERESAYHLQANTLVSSYFENQGGGHFVARAMPEAVQYAPVFGMLSRDVNGDGFEDVIMVGNDHGTDVGMGWMDAFNGLILLGDGIGGFRPVSYAESGFFVPGSGKALVQLVSGTETVFLASQNNDALVAFQPNSASRVYQPEAMDVSVTFYDAVGKKLKTAECYYGNGFLSQSGRAVAYPEQAVKAKVMNFKGEVREVVLGR